MLKHHLDRYKTQAMCDKAIDAFLPALKFIFGWSFARKMLEKFDNAVFSDDDGNLGLMI